MPNNYLLIVEGSCDEKNIFGDIFVSYGFNVIKCQEKMTTDGFGDFYKYELSQDKDNIVIIEGPRNRIHDFLIYYDKEIDSIEKLFNYSVNYFSGIFLIYDVDHNDNDDINEMFDKFNDESSGLLLLNSPCLEVLSDTGIKEDYFIKCNHLTEYKSRLNVYHEKHGNINLKEYIKNNFNKIILYFLDQNTKEFNEHNIMNHPFLVKEEINKKNIRYNFKDKNKSYVLYRYFTTVLYVSIAYSKKLVYDIDNYDIVRKFFAKNE